VAEQVLTLALVTAGEAGPQRPAAQAADERRRGTARLRYRRMRYLRMRYRRMRYLRMRYLRMWYGGKRYRTIWC
jgi:hypothetical protein